MADQDQEKNAAEVQQVDADPWAAAFAALDREEQEGAQGAADTGDGDGGQPTAEDLLDTKDADQGEGTIAPEGDDGAGIEGLPGGPGDIAGADGNTDGDTGWIGADLSEEEIKQYKEQLTEDVRQRAINDVAQAYINKGARHTNGRLGASINDPDVCKRDSDGVPRFYNPETGREFTGDNPRRQAQEWVDDYNRDLREAFNNSCAQYEQHLMQQEGGKLAIIEFTPKYKKLDPVRRSMFEAIIEDYEITDDNGDIVGYSCDLDKVLASVNRQVKVIQQRYAHHKQPTEPSGPALDTPSTSGQTANGKPHFKSIEEAMEWEQDQILAKMRGNAR